jgi:hypothetical protein
MLKIVVACVAVKAVIVPGTDPAIQPIGAIETTPARFEDTAARQLVPFVLIQAL